MIGETKDISENVLENFKNTLKICEDIGISVEGVSIDEKILYYLKRTNGKLVLIFNNFDKLFDENGFFKAENIKSFFEFFSKSV